MRRAGEPSPVKPTGWPFSLEWIHLISVGIDFYPRWLFHGVKVTAARGSSAVALAEFALASILGVVKRFPDIWINRVEQWVPAPIGMVQGAKLGIVGFGAVGEALAPRAQALGLEVMAVRRSTTPLTVSGVIQVENITELIGRVDHLVLAAPATAETYHLLSEAVLQQAKPGLHVVNIARGSLIDDEALLRALDDGRIGWASLDVTDPEPLPSEHRYYTHPRVRLLPHTSVHTSDTLRNLVGQFARNLDCFRSGKPIDGVVNLARGY